MNTEPMNLDLAYLHMLTDGNKEFEKKLLAGAVADVDKLMLTLKEAWSTKNAAVIRKSAHSLVSLVAIVGIPGIEGWCRQIDRTFVDEVFHPEYEVLVTDIVSCWPGAYGQLKEILNSLNEAVMQQ